jgi:hypothetical protein
MDDEISEYIENPMNVIIVPVAEVVGVEVMGEVLVESKRNTNHTCIDKLKTYAFICISGLIMISAFGFVAILVILFLSPKTLGVPDY